MVAWTYTSCLVVTKLCHCSVIGYTPVQGPDESRNYGPEELIRNQLCTKDFLMLLIQRPTQQG